MIDGVPVTEAQIADWVAEAEVGYDVEELKRRGRGRPGRGAEPAQVVALRLTAEELEALDARAAREHKSRSELIREAIAAFAAWGFTESALKHGLSRDDILQAAAWPLWIEDLDEESPARQLRLGFDTQG